MSDGRKFCKDCKHFRDAGAILYGPMWPSTCNQPEDRDLIYGRKIPTSPERMRAESGACKPAALLWEIKPVPDIPITVEPAKIPHEAAEIPNPFLYDWRSNALRERAPPQEIESTPFWRTAIQRFIARIHRDAS